MLGYESVSADYDVVDAFDYLPMKANLEDLQMQALQNRPDLRAAVQGVTAANSGYVLAKADGKQDVTVTGNYSHVNGINAATFYASIPLAIFDRNQGEIARTKSVITQIAGTSSVHQWPGIDRRERRLRRSEIQRTKWFCCTGTSTGTSRRESRDIADYAYHRGGIPLLDFLDAERSYRAAELGYRQTLASYLLAVEQLREAVGVRNLPVIRSATRSQGTNLVRPCKHLC